MKRILVGVLAVAMGVLFCACAPQSAPPGKGVASARAFVQLEDARLLSESKAYVRRDAVAAPAEKYLLTATVKPFSANADYKLGLSAASNAAEQNLDFVLQPGTEELASYATLYGTEKRYDLGYRRIRAEGAANDGVELTVIRNGTLFYFLSGGVLRQMREFDILPSVPGYTAFNCGAEVTKAVYTADPAEVDAAIADCTAAYPGVGLGNCYANFSGMEFTDTSVRFPEELRLKPFEYSRMAFEGRYSGDVEVTFTTLNLTPRADNDTAGNLWPKLALLIYYEQGYEDMLCIGVGKKQDRIETCIYNGFEQWYNHADFTGDPSVTSVIPRAGELRFRIRITNTGAAKAFRIYVNDALFALRTSAAYGDIGFGFAAEYVSGTVKDFAVRAV